MPHLNAKQIKDQLPAVPAWAKRGQTISRTYQFKSFLPAIAFVKRLASKAEKANHHPDIDIRWNKVKLVFTTHDQGGLTDKDFTMARQCDGAFGTRSVPKK